MVVGGGGRSLELRLETEDGRWRIRPVPWADERSRRPRKGLNAKRSGLSSSLCETSERPYNNRQRTDCFFASPFPQRNGLQLRQSLSTTMMASDC